MYICYILIIDINASLSIIYIRFESDDSLDMNDDDFKTGEYAKKIQGLLPTLNISFFFSLMFIVVFVSTEERRKSTVTPPMPPTPTPLPVTNRDDEVEFGTMKIEKKGDGYFFSTPPCLSLSLSYSSYSLPSYLTSPSCV
jgi:hypothetical protein